MSKLDHAASLVSSDAASTRKPTRQQRTIKRKPINTSYDRLYLRRKEAKLVIGNDRVRSREHKSGEFKAAQPRSLMVECQGARATCSDAERRDDRIGERALPLLKCDHGGGKFLLLFYI